MIITYISRSIDFVILHTNHSVKQNAAPDQGLHYLQLRPEVFRQINIKLAFDLQYVLCIIGRRIFFCFADETKEEGGWCGEMGWGA